MTTNSSKLKRVSSHKTTPKADQTDKVVYVKQIDGKSAIRQSIIDDVRKNRKVFKTVSEWGARPAKSLDGEDWDYDSIALHHAGNSYSCRAKPLNLMRQAEDTDISSFNHFSYHYAVGCDGTIFEALDIRLKGAHVEGGNTKIIGIVFLADFSLPGEATTYAPTVSEVNKKRGMIAAIKEFIGQKKDAMDSDNDIPTRVQIDAAATLVQVLTRHFPVKKLGGHREFAQRHGSTRACPGTFGLAIAQGFRNSFKLEKP